MVIVSYTSVSMNGRFCDLLTTENDVISRDVKRLSVYRFRISKTVYCFQLSAKLLATEGRFVPQRGNRPPSLTHWHVSLVCVTWYSSKMKGRAGEEYIAFRATLSPGRSLTWAWMANVEGRRQLTTVSRLARRPTVATWMRVGGINNIIACGWRHTCVWRERRGGRTKIAVNAHKCISTRDNENVITYNRGVFVVDQSKEDISDCKGQRDVAMATKFWPK